MVRTVQLASQMGCHVQKRNSKVGLKVNQKFLYPAKCNPVSSGFEHAPDLAASK